MKKFVFNDYSIIKPSKEIQKDWKDNYLSQLNSTDNGLRVTIIASHSGIVNTNMKFYVPSRMEDGVQSFVGEKPRKILKHHKLDEDPVGIIRSAEYVHTIPEELRDLPEIVTLTDPYASEEEQLKAVVDFIQTGIPLTESWTGLGYIKLVADIIDEKAIKEVVSGLFDSVSTHFSPLPGSVFCTCGRNMVEEGPCEHERGEIFKDEDDNERLCLWVPMAHHNKECSLVNIGADSRTSISINSEEEEEQDIVGSYLDSEFLSKTIENKQFFQFRDFKEDITMTVPVKKEKLSEGVQKILVAITEWRPEGKAEVLESHAKKIFQACDEEGKLPEQELAGIDDATAMLYALEDLENSDQTIDADTIYVEIVKELEELKMEDSKLAKEELDKLPLSSFAGPERSFPIHDEAHLKASSVFLDKYQGPGNKISILASINRKAKAMGSDLGSLDSTSGDVQEPEVKETNEEKDSFATPTGEEIKSLKDEEIQVLFAFAESELISRDLKAARDCSTCASHLETETQLTEKLETQKKELLDSADTLKVLRQELKFQLTDYVHQVDEYITLDLELKKAKLEKVAMVNVLSGKYKDQEEALVDLNTMSFTDALASQEAFSMKDATTKLNDGLGTAPEGKVVTPAFDESADTAGLCEPAKEAISNIKAFLEDGEEEEARNLFVQMDSLDLFETSSTDAKITFESIYNEIKGSDE